jgi:hypothetical protein
LIANIKGKSFWKLGTFVLHKLCHCGLDPQSHVVKRVNYEIAGQARNDNAQNQVLTQIK